MVKKIIWSPQAKQTFFNVVEYLNNRWTEKEIIKFVSKTDKILDILSSGNASFRSSGRKDTFEVLITKHNLLVYKSKPNSIELLWFYDTRQHPKKKKRIFE